MGRLTIWFKNLKKWQKGGLIGCGVGILLAAIVIIEPGGRSPGGWIINFHAIFYMLLFITFYSSEIVCGGGAGAIAIFYAGLGAIWGAIQQINNPYWKWPLITLLALFLAAFYTVNVLST